MYVGVQSQVAAFHIH